MESLKRKARKIATELRESGGEEALDPQRVSDVESCVNELTFHITKADEDPNYMHPRDKQTLINVRDDKK